MTQKLHFLHTADWQIGRQFGTLAEGDAAAALRLQRLETVKRIAELARERNVDFVLVAGDVFDANAVADETLRRAMHALESFDGPWVLLPGNHDSGEEQSAWHRLRRMGAVPKNVILADQPGIIELCDGRAAVLAAPLQRRHEVGDLTEWFDEAETPSGAFRIGLAHGSITNRLPEAAEAMNPIADTRAETARLDYLALGDWHGTLEVAPRTWYSGTPEQDRFRGNDPGNVLIVTLEEGRSPAVERFPIGRYRWRELDFDIGGSESVSVLNHRLAELADGEPERLVVNLRLRGDTDFATRSDLDACLADWQARLHVLRLDDTDLHARPSDDDIADMAVTGYVREALTTLLAMADAPDSPERETAARALQILYREHEALKS